MERRVLFVAVAKRQCFAWRFFMLEGLLQPTHLLLIFGIALLFFGPRKLPEFGKGLGQGIRALKEGVKGALPDAEENVSREPRA
jgi:sec-independent protein translocase protein TatA